MKEPVSALSPAALGRAQRRVDLKFIVDFNAEGANSSILFDRQAIGRLPGNAVGAGEQYWTS
jgi:hypothetical protein